MSRKALESKTVAALKKQATELSIAGRSKMKKAALVDAILAASTSETAEAATAAVELSVAEVDDTAAEAPLTSEPIEAAAVVEAVEAVETIEAVASVEAVEAVEAATVGETGETNKTASPEAVAPTVEPSADDVFIDRGEPIPESYPGERMRVLVRDPGSLYVYWETEDGDPAGWEVSAERDGQVLHGFHADDPTSGGYLRAPAADVQRVTVRSPRRPPRFVAELPRAAQQAPTAPVLPEERWTSFQPPEERPAPTASFPVSSPVPPSIKLPLPAEPPSSTSSTSSTSPSPSPSPSPSLPGSHTPQSRG